MTNVTKRRQAAQHKEWHISGADNFGNIGCMGRLTDVEIWPHISTTSHGEIDNYE
jgi:hypothetical protein